MSTTIPLTERQQIIHLLARRFYRHFCEHRSRDLNPPPYVPGWAIAYAELAVVYLGYDDDAVDALKEDYK